MTKNNIVVEKLKQYLAQVRGKIQGTTANDVTTAGTAMEDGSVFAGWTGFGKQIAGMTGFGKQIYAMPTDLGFTATFNDAANAVEKLNEEKALGHDDWQIPDLNTLEVLRRNKNQGSLKGTFNTSNKGSGSDYPGWYWSSTDPDYSSAMCNVRLSDGTLDWLPRESRRLSCRPVRLVAPAPSRG